MKHRYPLDWIWQGHCMNCAGKLSECICIDGPTHPRPIEELKAERDRVQRSIPTPKKDGGR